MRPAAQRCNHRRDQGRERHTRSGDAREPGSDLAAPIDHRVRLSSPEKRPASSRRPAAFRTHDLHATYVRDRPESQKQGYPPQARLKPAYSGHHAFNFAMASPESQSGDQRVSLDGEARPDDGIRHPLCPLSMRDVAADTGFLAADHTPGTPGKTRPRQTNTIEISQTPTITRSPRTDSPQPTRPTLPATSGTSQHESRGDLDAEPSRNNYLQNSLIYAIRDDQAYLSSRDSVSALGCLSSTGAGDGDLGKPEC